MSGTTETTQRPASKARTSAVKVDIAPPASAASHATKRFWVGTMPDCPIQNVTVGGVSFPRFRGNPVFDQEGGLPDREIVHGIYADLTEAQVERVRASVAIRCVRSFGAARGVADGYEDAPEVTPTKGKAAQMLMTDGPNYVRDRRDVPLARLLYMHRLDLMTGEDTHRFPPEPMASA